MKHKIFYITSDSFMDIQDEDKVSSELQSVFFSNHLCSVFSVYPYTLSTKKDFLHSACSNNGFIFRIRFTLGCRAVRGTTRGRALWRTQVVHQWEAVLSTEVHKFYLSDTTVKVDSCREKGISAK